MLFKKAALFGDIHLGLRNDSEQHNIDCIEFIQWFIEQTKINNCDTIIFLGDFMHNPKSMTTLTKNYAKQAIDLLANTGLSIYWIVANHDLFYRENRTIHSVPYLELYENINIINEVKLIDDCIFAPWLIGEEYVLVTEQKAKYIFAHLELPLFLYNKMLESPDHGGLHGDHFYQCEAVFSGHYHLRQTKKNSAGIPIYYIGNPFGHNYNDVNDRSRGMCVLEWDKDPIFIDYDGPNFNRIYMSDMLNIIEKDEIGIYFNCKSNIECIDDINIGMENCMTVKDIISPLVRSLKMVEFVEEKIEPEVNTQESNETIEDFIERQLLIFDGDKYDNEFLVTLFKESK